MKINRLFFFQLGPHPFRDIFQNSGYYEQCHTWISFFRKCDITVDPERHLLDLQDLTVQLNKVLPEQDK